MSQGNTDEGHPAELRRRPGLRRQLEGRALIERVDNQKRVRWRSVFTVESGNPDRVVGPGTFLLQLAGDVTLDATIRHHFGTKIYLIGTAPLPDSVPDDIIPEPAWPEAARPVDDDEIAEDGPEGPE